MTIASANLYSSNRPLSSSSVSFITNHQKWQIRTQLNQDAHGIVFHVMDPYGVTYAVTDFIIEDVDLQLQTQLCQSASFSESQELIYDYLQSRLERANPYQLHIEKSGNKLVLRLGEYGLKGGGKEEGYALSTLQVFGGAAILYLSDGKFAKLGGCTLIGSGISSAIHTYKIEKEEEFKLNEYLKRSAQNIAAGFSGGFIAQQLISFNPTSLSEGMKAVRDAFCHGIGALTGSFLVSSAAAKIEKRENVDYRDMLIRAGALGSGTFAGHIFAGIVFHVGELVASNKICSETATTALQMAKEVIEKHTPITEHHLGLLGPLLKQVGKGSLEGAISSTGSTLVSHAITEGRKDIYRETIQAALVSSLVGGLVSCVGEVRHIRLIQQEQKLRLQQEQAHNEFHKATEEQQQQETSFESLKKTLDLAEQDVQQNEAHIKQLKQDLKNLQNAQQQKASEQEHLQKAIAEAKNQVQRKQQESQASKQEVKEVKNKLRQLDAEPARARRSDPLKVKDEMRIVKELKRAEKHHKFDRKELGKVEGSLHQLEANQAQLEAQLKQSQMESQKLSETSLTKSTQLDATKEYVAELKRSIPSAKQALNNAESKAQDWAKQLTKTEADFQSTQEKIRLQGQSKMKGDLSVFPVRRADLPDSNLQTVLKPESISFVEKKDKIDCTMQELVPHVVLVQTLNQTSLAYHDPEADLIRCETDHEYAAFCSIRGVITPLGVIGHHLQLKKQEFQGEFRDRPHLHWGWNQMVQPNSGGSWEDSLVAVLEPLSTFQDSVNHKPYGVAPYDTLTFGSHRLSNRSVVLIPEGLIAETRKYLCEPLFLGKIVTYDPKKISLRAAIIEALQTNYKDVWHVCDAEGNLTGNKAVPTPTGHLHVTHLKKANGDVLVLIRNAGTHPSDLACKAMEEFNVSQQFIGLHNNKCLQTGSLTVYLEDDPYFKAIAAFKQNSNKAKGYTFFSGNLKNVNELVKIESGRVKLTGILLAYDIYQKLYSRNPKTGVFDVAEYILNEAMNADLASLFYKMYPNSKFDLSILDLKIIFSSMHYCLATLLDDIYNCLISSDIKKKNKAREFFEKYCTLLKQSLEDIIKLKKEVQRKLEDTNKKSVQSYNNGMIPLCLLVAQDEWSAIDVPEKIDFDLGKNWPPISEKLYSYTYKVESTLPTDPDKLVELYHYLSSIASKAGNTTESRKKQYQLNIVRSIIQWELQEALYLEERKGIEPVLAKKLARQAGIASWFEEYCLDIVDHTEKLGDCLFDNVATQLYGNPAQSQNLRLEMVKFMKLNETEYSKKPDYNVENKFPVAEGILFKFYHNWGQYLDCLAQSQVWATEIEVSALSFMLGSPIVLITRDAKPKIYNPEGKNEPILIHHVNTNHFESCSPFKGLTPRNIYELIKHQAHY